MTSTPPDVRRTQSPPPGAPLARLAPVAALCLLASAYHGIFAEHFAPGRAVAADYALSLPAMLAGYIWFHNAGPWQVPWFTPAFCGGQPYFADPQSAYYSLMQVFTLFADPLAASYYTMLALAALGYLGTYLLLRAGFELGRSAAIFGAAVFMFNGFFAVRMLAGHLGYHGFMVVPCLPAILLLRRPQSLPPWLGETWLGVAAGTCAAYLVHSGLGTLLVPAGLSIAAICALRASLPSPPRLSLFVLRSVIGLSVGASLSAAKVSAGLAFLAQLGSRSQYPLPGFEGVYETLKLAFLSLFVSPDDMAQRAGEHLRNDQWLLERHELEYGVTAVPLLVALAGAAFAVVDARRRRAARATSRVEPRRRGLQLALLSAIVVILLIPIALNVFTPGWNALLKRTPLLMSASSLVRWFCLYVPFVAVLGALGLSRVRDRLQPVVAALSCLVIVVLNLTQDRSFVLALPYDPRVMTAAYTAIAASDLVPEIRDIAVMVSADNQVVIAVNRNDVIADNRSQLACYNPIFGYGLESFPVKSLRPGPVRDVAGGYYNVKNPACYVFPDENHCTPGDHFRVDQAASMERFVHYQPFPFAVSRAQERADTVTRAALVLCALVWLAALGFAVSRPRVEADAATTR